MISQMHDFYSMPKIFFFLICDSGMNFDGQESFIFRTFAVAIFSDFSSIIHVPFPVLFNFVAPNYID